MIAIFKFGFVLVLLMHVMTSTSAAGAVGNLVGAVGGLGGEVLKPIVCLEESVVDILSTLLTGLGLGELGALLISVLGPELAVINNLLESILAILS